jgi:flagellar motor component MotA
MSIKSIIFFSVIFGFIIFGYFYYERFLQIFPIHIIIKLFIVIIGIFAIFFPQIIKKLRDGEDMEEIKEFIIEKYKKK